MEEIVHRSYMGRRKFVMLGAAAASSALLFGIQSAIPNHMALAATPSNDLSFTTGTYTGQAEGKKGPVTVEVTFTDNAIKSVEVVDFYETPRISKAAFDRIPAEIVQYQSLGVDTVTGATFSSMGVLNATADCVKQAGGDVEALKAVPGAPKNTNTEEINADIVVIGAGAAGMPAALEAAMNGAKVVVFEKCANIGGNALVSGGVLGYINAPDELRQQMTDGYRAYFEQILDKVAEMGCPQDKIDAVRAEYDEYYASGKTTVFDSVGWEALYSIVGSGASEYSDELYDLYYAYLEQNVMLMEWLEQFEIDYKKLVAVAGYPWPDCTSPADGECGEGYFAAFDRFMDKNSLSLDLLLSTPASELMTDDKGTVVGVKGVCEDGTTYIVNAAKAVIIATGGFAGNPDLLREHDQEWGFADVDYIPTTNNYGHTGDGLELAMSVGGAYSDAETNFMVLPFANAVDLSVESIVGNSGNSLLVNIEGKRFVDETKSRNAISKEEMKQPEQRCYLISDVNNSLIEDGYNMFGTDVSMLLSHDKLFKADTLEELAELIDIDPKTLVETVETYNKYAKAGEDPDFGRTMFDETSPVVEGPFYANPCSWAVHITTAGIMTDFESYEVLNEKGEPVKGLYAVGECMPCGGGLNVMSNGLVLADQLTL